MSFWHYRDSLFCLGINKNMYFCQLREMKRNWPLKVVFPGVRSYVSRDHLRFAETSLQLPVFQFVDPCTGRRRHSYPRRDVPDVHNAPWLCSAPETWVKSFFYNITTGFQWNFILELIGKSIIYISQYT